MTDKKVDMSMKKKKIALTPLDLKEPEYCAGLEGLVKVYSCYVNGQKFISEDLAVSKDEIQNKIDTLRLQLNNMGDSNHSDYQKGAYNTLSLVLDMFESLLNGGKDE